MKIPKGWHKLRKGTMLKEGDKYLSAFGKWCITTAYGNLIDGTLTYIRKNK